MQSNYHSKGGCRAAAFERLKHSRHVFGSHFCCLPLPLCFAFRCRFFFSQLGSQFWNQNFPGLTEPIWTHIVFLLSMAQRRPTFGYQFGFPVLDHSLKKNGTQIELWRSQNYEPKRNHSSCGWRICQPLATACRMRCGSMSMKYHSNIIMGAGRVFVKKLFLQRKKAYAGQSIHM